jgi:hypothetical protein
MAMIEDWQHIGRDQLGRKGDLYSKSLGRLLALCTDHPVEERHAVREKAHTLHDLRRRGVLVTD